MRKVIFFCDMGKNVVKVADSTSDNLDNKMIKLS